MLRLNIFDVFLIPLSMAYEPDKFTFALKSQPLLL